MEANIGAFASIAIVGAALSLVINFIKGKWGTDTGITKLITIGLSVLLGVGYYFLEGTAIWKSILGILGASSAFWAIFLKK